MVDMDLIYRKISLITPDLQALEELCSRSLEAFLGDEIATVLAERYLERVIGRMIDINYHLITSEGCPPPKDYYSSFIQISKKPNILDHELAARMANAAGLRNRIAHEYDELNPTLLYEGMRSAVKEIPLYIKAAVKYLEPGKKD